jgi:hypothetical protein
MFRVTTSLDFEKRIKVREFSYECLLFIFYFTVLFYSLLVQGSVIGVSKHLCGAATDLAFKRVLERM